LASSLPPMSKPVTQGGTIRTGNLSAWVG